MYGIPGDSDLGGDVVVGKCAIGKDHRPLDDIGPTRSGSVGFVWDGSRDSIQYKCAVPLSLVRYPLAYHITFGTYGMRLHGDARGTVDRRVNQPGDAIVGRCE